MNSFIPFPFPHSPCFAPPFRSLPLAASLWETPWLNRSHEHASIKCFAVPRHSFRPATMLSRRIHPAGAWKLWVGSRASWCDRERCARRKHCPPSPSRSLLFLAPIVHQISGIPKYEPTPHPPGLPATSPHISF